MKKLNKTTAAAVAGAVVGLLASLIDMTPAAQSAAATLLTMLAVYFVPNATE